jgi:hypothetical protein
MAEVKEESRGQSVTITTECLNKTNENQAEVGKIHEKACCFLIAYPKLTEAQLLPITLLLSSPRLYSVLSSPIHANPQFLLNS